MNINPKAYQPVIEKLFGPLNVEDQETKTNIVSAEKRLGLRLPKTLRDFYLFAGRQPQLTASYNRILPVDSLLVDGDTLIFCIDNEGEVLWGILEDHLVDTNPPVFRAFNTEGEEFTWEIDHEYLSDFLTTMAYWQAAAGGLEFLAVAAITENNLSTITSAFPSLPLGDNIWDMQVFGQDGILLCLIPIPAESSQDTAYQLMAAARTRAEFEQVQASLDIQWQYIEDQET